MTSDSLMSTSSATTTSCTKTACCEAPASPVRDAAWLRAARQRDRDLALHGEPRALRDAGANREESGRAELLATLRRTSRSNLDVPSSGITKRRGASSAWRSRRSASP
jgi:hypothetical protein